MFLPALLAQLPPETLAKAAQAVMQADSSLRMTLFQTIVKWSFSFTFIGMAVATVFLLIESTRVAAGHRLAILVGGLITFAATISYYYMSTTWIPGHYYMTEFRYADWTMTTPLLLLKLCAMAGKRRVGNGTMVALVSADLFMIITGYIGEQAINLRGAAGILAGNTALPLWMFLISCIGWLAVMAILFGPVKSAAMDAEPEERNAVNAMILFMVVGWAVYPLGHRFRLYWAPFGYVGDPNVDLRLGRSVASLDETPAGLTATLDDGSTIRASHAFDSRPPDECRRSAVEQMDQTARRLAAPLAGRVLHAPRPASGAAKRPASPASGPFRNAREVDFHQQFVGHFVRTDCPAFDPAAVTLMDFRAGQVSGAIRFVYFLPFDERHALVEATTISESPLPPAEHEAAIDDYLRRITGTDHWQVTAAERGAIPMDTTPRPVAVSPHVWRIGLNGGMAKPSTGYAFLAVQRFSKAAADRIARHRAGPLPAPPAVRSTPATALDRIFLARLRRRPGLAPALFARLFERADPAALVRFLSDRATPADVLAVVAALPKLPFAAEAVRSWRLWARIAPRRKPPTLVAGSGSPGLRPETSPPAPTFLANHTGASAPGY